MALTIGEDRRVYPHTRRRCGGEHETAVGYVYRDGDAHAVYFASCYPHHGEVWIDVILGTWGAGTDDDHVTFGCRFGPVDGQPGPACSLVQAASVRADSPLFGTKLDRAAALAHPWLAQFWDVVDLVLLEAPAVRALASSVAGTETPGS
jgi:hypothetical protein